MAKDIFLICKVRGCSPEEIERQRKYVENLERSGKMVHWPHRDTEQNDPTHGTNICRTTFQGIFEAQEVHVMWDLTSEGRFFDLGMVFALNELSKMFGGKKKVVIVNKNVVEEVIRKQLHKGITKSYDMVLRNLSEE